MGAGTTVEYVAQDMQRIDGKPLYQVAHGNDKVVGTVRINDCTDNYIDVCLLVRLHTAFVKQFLYDIGELFRQCLANLGDDTF